MSETLRTLPADKLIDARCTAEMIFKSLLNDQTEASELRDLACLAIEAAAVFWEQWTVEAMTESFVDQKEPAPVTNQTSIEST